MSSTLFRLFALVVGLAVACGCVERDAPERPNARDATTSFDASDRADAEMDPGPSELPPLPSQGCAKDTEALFPAGMTTLSQLSQGETIRTFRVQVPAGLERRDPRPLVLMFHGGGGTSRQFQELSARFDGVAEREQVISVYPDGSGALQTWNGGGCCGFAITNLIDDVGFVRLLLDHLEAELCVDRRRVFASGMSNGAILTHRLGCELADRIAAIAPVAGTDMTDLCEPARPLAVLQIHGTNDGHVPWDGGRGCGPSAADFNSVPSTIDAWRERNGCRPEPEPDQAMQLGSSDARCERYTRCNAGSDLVLCAILGGGHNWPGGEPPASVVSCPADGFQSSSFSASEAIWRFFAAHALPL